MTLRVNNRRLPRADYLAALQNQGFAATAGMLSPYAIYLANPIDVQDIPGFATGEVSVQDEAAQLAATLLRAQAGERVLDACAAPGGKACHILELHAGSVELVAMDIDAARLRKVSDNLQRLALAATVLTGDAAHPPAQLAPGSFDRILVDAPCSASGVIRRHPDIKLLRRESDIAPLAQRQFSILSGLWPLLKAGGSMLYVTCSILDEENSQVVQRFLAERSDADLVPACVPWGHAASCGRQLLQSTGGPDGLFFSLVRKAG